MWGILTINRWSRKFNDPAFTTNICRCSDGFDVFEFECFALIFCLFAVVVVELDCVLVCEHSNHKHSRQRHLSRFRIRLVIIITNRRWLYNNYFSAFDIIVDVILFIILVPQIDSKPITLCLLMVDEDESVSSIQRQTF